MSTNPKIEPFWISHGLELFVFMVPSNHMDNRDRLYAFEALKSGTISHFLASDPPFLKTNYGVDGESLVGWAQGSLGRGPRTSLDQITCLRYLERALGEKEISRLKSLLLSTYPRLS